MFGVSITTTGDAALGFTSLPALDALWNALLIQNLTGSKNILGTLWSLPIEVQMYVLLPAFFVLLRACSISVAVTTYVACILCSAVAFKFGGPELLRYLPCFLPGIIAWAFIDRFPRNMPFVSLPVMFTGMWAMYALTAGRSQTIAAYPICLMLGLLIPSVKESKNACLNRCCSAIAKYSYGIYLVHVPVLAGAFKLALPAPLQLAAFLIGTSALSVAAYRIV